MILIDNKYFAHQLRRARRNAHLKRTQAAQILKISRNDFARYERGKDVIPENLLQGMLYNAFLLMTAKYGPKKRN